MCLWSGYGTGQEQFFSRGRCTIVATGRQRGTGQYSSRKFDWRRTRLATSRFNWQHVRINHARAGWCIRFIRGVCFSVAGVACAAAIAGRRWWGSIPEFAGHCCRLCGQGQSQCRVG